MKNFRLPLIVFALLTFFSACKKDDAPIKPKTKAEMISSSSGKNWKLIASTVSFVENGKTETEDMLADYEPCDLDDLYILFADKKFEEKEGATKCDPSASDLIGSGTWELKNNDTEFILTSPSGSLAYKVLEISETTIRLEDSFSLADGTKLTFLETYKAQ